MSEETGKNCSCPGQIGFVRQDLSEKTKRWHFSWGKPWGVRIFTQDKAGGKN
jgi:hypothetical protein